MLAAQSKSIKVLVGDEHALMRAGIRHVLELYSNIGNIHEACDADNLYRTAKEMQPDLIILDISMSQGYGLTVLPLLRRDLPDTRLLIISLYNTPEYVQESMRCGVHGYLLKNADLVDVQAAIKAVLNGRKYFSPNLDDSPLRRNSPTCCITLRERQVLSMVVSGKTNKQIAAALGISHRTVETHRSSVVRKLGISSVAELTRYAIENGLSPKS